MASLTQPILPQEGKRNVLITSALPYVNNIPHLGNIIGSVLSADVFSRYCKGRGYPTLFICGTDEYGTATETKAIEEGVTPQELCDKYYKLHKSVYDWFEIAFDKFGRTPTQQQTDISQDIFLKLRKNGFLEEQESTQPYCEKHNAFLADRFIEGECPLCGYNDARGDQCDKCGQLLDAMDLKNPRCKLDGATPVLRDTKHIYIQLDKLQPKVQEWFEESVKKGSWSKNGEKITSSWLNEGLKPRAITRDLKWGTAVPLEGYEKKVLYVWFDACIGYVSITANYTDEWEQWWRNPENVQLFQFMGKDNVPFHSVVFPASQLGTGDKWTQAHHISTSEYLNYEKGKFSKSRGIGVFGTNAQDTGVPADVWRYYLLSHRPETGDSEFEWDKFIACNNSDLLKNLGNFVNRVIKFVGNASTFNSVVPEWNPDVLPASLTEHISATNSALKRYVEELEAVKLRAGLVTVLNISYLGNKLLQDHRLDNKLVEEQPELCAAVINIALNHIHLISSILRPYMPQTSDGILQQLNIALGSIPDEWTIEGFQVKPGHKIGSPAYLFTLIKPEKATEWRDLFGGEEAKKAKAEAAAKAAAKKADKERKKAKKQQQKEADSQGAVEGITAGVEKVEVKEEGK